MIVTTLDKVEGHRISKTLKPVTGSGVVAYWGDFPIFKMAKYAEKIIAEREKAITKMKKKAVGLGANAVVGVRFETAPVLCIRSVDTQSMQALLEILAYGTAVKLEKI